MPRTRSLAYSELKIGVLALLAIVIAAIVIFMLSGEGGFFWQRYYLKARFPNVAGLKSGAPVRLAGVEVGSVTGIEFAGSAVDVTFRVTREMQPRIRTGSVATIGSMGLLGQGTVDITASQKGTPIPAWGYVPSHAAGVQLADVAETADKGLQQATALLTELRQGKGTVGRLFTDDALYRDLTGFVAAAEDVANNLKGGRGTLGRLTTDPAVYNRLQASLTNLNDMLRRVNSGQGSLGRLVNDDRFANSLTSATGNIDTMTGRLNKGEGTADKLLTDAALYNRITSVADRLDQVVARLGQGQGTAGQLLQDRQLYENMNGAASELRALIGDIRKNPRKFLNVKVSVF